MAKFVNINVPLSSKKSYQKRVVSYVKIENSPVLIIIQEIIACKYILSCKLLFSKLVVIHM